MSRIFKPTASEQATAFSPLPQDNYIFRVGEMEIRPGRNDDQLMVPLTVVDGKHEGRRITDWLSYSAAAAYRLSSFLIACGVQDGEEIDIDDVVALNESFSGTIVTAFVKITTYQGTERNSISTYALMAKSEKKSRKKKPEPVEKPYDDDDIAW